MPDVLDQLQQFLTEQRKQADTEENREALRRLEEKVDALNGNGRPAAKTQREILAELAADDDFIAELEAELVAEADDLGSAAEDEDGDEDDENDEQDGDDGHDTGGIRFRRVSYPVPRIYSGEDEPDHVEYLDENGDVKVRAGRKRGQPVSEDYEEIDADDNDDDDDEQEDDE